MRSVEEIEADLNAARLRHDARRAEDQVEIDRLGAERDRALGSVKAQKMPPAWRDTLIDCAIRAMGQDDHNHLGEESFDIANWTFTVQAASSPEESPALPEME